MTPNDLRNKLHAWAHQQLQPTQPARPEQSESTQALPKEN
jgi:hypothetical protein